MLRRILNSRLARKVSRIESLGAFGQQLWGPLVYALTGGAGMIGALFAYLDGYGWLGTLAAALVVAFVAAIILLIVAKTKAAWPSKVNNPGHNMSDPSTSEDANSIGVYEGAHEELLLFVHDHIFPAFDYLNEVQNEIINHVAPNPSFARLARDGILGSVRHQTLSRALDRLGGLTNSPADYIAFGEMIDLVCSIEKGYFDYVMDINDLLKESGNEVGDLPKVKTVWEKWRTHHTQLIEAYESIKRKSKMGKLFRLGRPSRWGQLVCRDEITVQNQFLKPRDTVA